MDHVSRRELIQSYCTEMRFNMQNEVLRRIQDNVAKVMIGKEEVTKLLLASLAAGGTCIAGRCTRNR